MKRRWIAGLAVIALCGCHKEVYDTRSEEEADLTKAIECRIESRDEDTLEVDIYRVHTEEADLPYDTYFVDISDAVCKIDKEVLDQDYPVWMILEEEDFSSQNLKASEVGGFTQ